MPLFRGMKRWKYVLPTLLLSSLLFAACGGTGRSSSVLDPAGPVASSEAGLFWFILIVATIVFVAVEGLLIWSVFRYRARPNTPMPNQTHGNNRLELAWTIVPSIFLFLVLGFTISTMVNISTVPAGNSLEIRAVGHQWWWEFDYPNQKIVTADDLVVPVGTVVHVSLYSNNVIHSFWVPQLTGKTDVIPGHDNQKWFKADRTGTFDGVCAEFCGAQHAHMLFNVRVLSNDDYATWVTGQQQVAQSNAQVQAGADLFKAKGCSGCHGIVGVNLTPDNNAQPQVLIGPNLTHFGSRDLIAGGVLANNPANLAKWLKDPQSVKPGNDMPNLGLSQPDIDNLVAYLDSLK